MSDSKFAWKPGDWFMRAIPAYINGKAYASQLYIFCPECLPQSGFYGQRGIPIPGFVLESMRATAGLDEIRCCSCRRVHGDSSEVS